jgi:ubiquinone/menaquinone biosynthesis C-methylase UbiE
MNRELDRSGRQQGDLWGRRARDWSEIQEHAALPGYEAVFDRVELKGTRYLDAGCGSGLAAQIAAGRGAMVSGLDAAENLIAIARSRVPGGDFRVGELEELPYRDQSFDLVTGFNSFQFAVRPAAALKEARRVVRSGGLVVVTTWGKPEGMEWAAVLGALKSIVPPPPPGTPGPFALSEERALRALAESVDLKPEEILDVVGAQRYPDLEIALRGLMSAGAAARALERAGEDTVRRAYTEVLQRFRQSDGSYRIGLGVRCLFARR